MFSLKAVMLYVVSEPPKRLIVTDVMEGSVCVISNHELTVSHVKSPQLDVRVSPLPKGVSS